MSACDLNSAWSPWRDSSSLGASSRSYASPSVRGTLTGVSNESFINGTRGGWVFRDWLSVSVVQHSAKD